MDDTITIPELTPDQQDAVSRALATWVVPLRDFYRNLVAMDVPADLANGLAISFWEATLAAGYAADYE